MDDITELDDTSVFKIEPLPKRSYEKDYIAQVDITIEVNRNQLVIARDGYTFLDFLSDIGGMQGMLLSGANFVLVFWNYNFFDNFMVTRLYKIYKPSSERKI